MKTALKTLMMAAGCVAAGFSGMGQAAIAAERVVLTYGFVSMDIPIEDLENLTDTGETSDDLEQLLMLSEQEPETVRSTLSRPVAMSPVTLDLALNSSPGEWMLDRLSETIQPASGEGGRSAMRAALVGASSNDGELTLLEIMQVYPSPDIVVQGDRILEAYGFMAEVFEPFEDLAEILGSLEF